MKIKLRSRGLFPECKWKQTVKLEENVRTKHRCDTGWQVSRGLCSCPRPQIGLVCERPWVQSLGPCLKKVEWRSRSIFLYTHVCHCTHTWVCNWNSSVLKASTSVDSTLLKECHLDLHDYHVTCFCDVDSLDSMCQIRWHLYLVYFSECNVFSVHPCCCKWHYIFFFHLRIDGI